MKLKTRSFTPVQVLIFALAAWTSHLFATPVITTATNTPAAETATTSTTDETIYNASVSTTDLLHGITGTGGTWNNNSNGANVTGLNNGTGAGDSNVSVADGLTGAAWAANSTASFREFSLGNGANGLGCDITEVQSIAAWQGASFQNQKYEILVSTVGSAAFTLVATVDFQPASGTAGSVQGGATKVNVTDTTGILSTGIDAIRFNILDSSGATAGGTVFREIDVFGISTPSGPDLTPPTLNTLTSVTPTDESMNVPVSSNLTATFSEPIALTGAGSITIQDLETPTQTVITLPDARVSVSGTVLTINPSTNLSATTDYAVRIASGAITDIAGNPFTGISDDSTWNFTTATSPLRIMCLGDSITAGYTDNPSWANHPFMFGYRSGLYSRLTNAGYNFQLVGASTEPWSATQNGDPTYGGTYKPALDLRDFGQDGHCGYGGAAIWSNVNGWIAADDPDVILLMIGINGIGSGSPAALNNLVNSILTTAPGVHLIIAQITPRVSFNQALYDYNLYIRNTLVPTFAGNGHKVTTVDLYSLFLTDPNNYSSAIKAGVLANNINHPNNPQYDLMAQEWFEGIEALRIGPNTFAKWITDPALGIAPGQQGLDQDPDGDGIDNGGENFFGTDPGEFNPGLVAGAKSGSIFTFTHPQNPSPAIDLSATYHWTKNLASFHAGGATDSLTTVTFAAEANTPSLGTTRVTATVTGTSPDKLFIKVGVSSH